MDLESIKKNFFDKKAITDKIDPEVRKALSKFGAFVRQRDKTSMKKRKGIAPAGSPPFAHEGSIKKFTFFAFDPSSKSVVIGPVLAGPAAGGLKLIEEGGTSVLHEKTKARTVRYAPHPHTGPAFQAELPKAADRFKGIIKG